MLRDNICQNSWRSVFVIEPTDMLSQDSFKELHTELESEIISSPAKAQYLEESTQTDAYYEYGEDYSPNVSLLLKISHFLI